MGQRVTKNMISKTFFGRFLLNISVNMKDREKFVINFFVENKIVRKKKFIEIGLRVHELWSKKWSQWGA